MHQLSAIRSFVETVDQGSLKRAAEHLGLSRAMVRRHLERLDGWLGARRPHRTTRRVSLRAAGEGALPRLRQMLDLAADLQAVSGASRAEPFGKRRSTTSSSNSGDDADTKHAVRQLLEAIGYFPVDLGLLAAGGQLSQVLGRIDQALADALRQLSIAL